MPSQPILVLNSGSSSIKFSVYETADGSRVKLHEGAVDGIGTDRGEFWIRDGAGAMLTNQTPPVPTRAAAFKLVADAVHSAAFPRPLAIGHRMVSGGPTIVENQRITPALIDEMERYSAFAPLHTPIAILIMRQSLAHFPGIANFVVLDTYFHRTISDMAKLMPIPTAYAEMGVRRYGAHGISCESIVYQLEPDVPGKLIVAHLGNGASLTAIRQGLSLDTSMGLTPTGGLISGTRTGDIDPGVLLFLLRKIAETEAGTPAAADRLEALATGESGLLGMSGLSNDMRKLRQAIAGGDRRARQAVDKFVWTIQKWIGSFFVELGGLEMLVFTGGIGENDSASRLEICAGLEALDVKLDPERNRAPGPGLISAPDSRVMVRVIPPAEDLMIVNHVVSLMAL